jgi:NADH-quinone oxidoreductase subunit H
MCVLIPVIVAGTLNLTTIGVEQAGGFWRWQIFHDPFTFFAFWVFFICALSSCKRAPFDLAEAESELVAGFHTEYSGFRWSVFFLAEYGSMFAVSGLAVLLFLGGWHTGFLPAEPVEMLGPTLGNLIDLLVFVGKGWFLVAVMMWVRWTLPRLRVDQVMTTCLKYLLPISCVLLVGVCLWQLLVPTDWREAFRLVLAFGSLGLAVLAVARVLTKPGDVPAGELAGVWEGTRTPLMRK